MSDSDLKPYIDFAINTLMPVGSMILAKTYAAYCAGKNIDIQTKDDNSPASAADREAEYAMRKLIAKHYPKHGIWGEEYGTHQLNSDYVWILDPLDGTKEFISKNPHHFGLLIGLFHNGRPVFGIIHDPINNKTWRSDQTTPKTQEGTEIENAGISCTRRTMFDGLKNKPQILGVLDQCGKEFPKLNCIGFAHVADGQIHAAIEHDLNLHDIAAVLPILFAAGARVVDFDGKDYKNYAFDFNDYGKRNYSIIAALDAGLVKSIIKDIR